VGFKQPPLIFLVTGPKGRSPVTKLLATHERIAFLPDTGWITDLASQRRAFETPGGAKAFTEAFLDHRTSGAWSLGRDEVLQACESAEDYPAMVRAVLNTYASHLEGKGFVLVDNSPHVAANLHLLTLLTKKARVLVIKEPGLTVDAPVRGGYDMWFSGQTAVTDALATLERDRFAQMRLDDLLKDPVGSIRTLIAYLEVGLGLDGFTRVEGLPSATKPGRALRFGPQRPGEQELAPVRWARAFFERYPKLGRKARAWANNNRPLVNRTLKKLRKVAR
jgi:hypothetical protein